MPGQHPAEARVQAAAAPAPSRSLPCPGVGDIGNQGLEMRISSTTTRATRSRFSLPAR